MFDIDNYIELWQTVTRNKARSVMTAFGIFWGIFLLVVMMGLSGSIRNGIMKNTEDMAVNSAAFFPGTTSEAYKGFEKGRNWSLHNSDMTAVEAQFGNRLKRVIPVVWGLPNWDGSTNNAVRGSRTGAYSEIGFSSYYIEMQPSRILKGRFLNEIDVCNARKVCVIGSRVYNDLYSPGEDPVGTTIRVSGIYYTVIGVMESKSEQIQMFGRSDEMIIMPYTTVQRSNNLGDKITFMAVVAKDNQDISVLEKEICSYLKARNFVSPTDETGLEGQNIKEIFDMFNTLFAGLDILVWIVGLSTLFAGIIGVSNIMLITVRERTQEIGIRRALGATPYAILRQIMSESLVLTVIAGSLGITVAVLLLGVAEMLVAGIPAQQMPFHDFQINFYVAVAALMVLVVSGLLAGYLPSRRALSIRAVEALQDE